MTQDFSHVSRNIMAEAARRGMSRHTIYTKMGWTYTPWQRRMQNPGMWTIGELVKIAAIIGCPLVDLLGSLVDALPILEEDGSITLNEYAGA